jgi:hypothetical protein
MQRVLYEILRRSNENMEKTQNQSRKRKPEALLAADDGKFAERLYSRQTRGPRPGMVDWSAKRRRVSEEWDLSNYRRTHLTG